MDDKKFRRFLLILFIAALLLRAVQITWGSPYLDKYSSRFNKDEPTIIKTIEHFPLDIKKERVVHDPVMAPIIASIAYPIKFAMFKLGYEQNIRMAAYELFIKIVLILVSAANAYLVVKLCLLLKVDRILSLIAGFLFAVAPISVETAARIKPEPLLCFMITLFIYYACKIHKDVVQINVRSIIKLSIIFGLSMGTKYTAVLAAPVFAVILLKPLIEKHFAKATFYSLISIIVSGSVFLLNIPSAILDISVLSETYSYMQKSVGNNFDSTLKIKKSLGMLSRAAGIPIFALGIAGFILNLKDFRQYIILYVSSIFLFLGTSSVPLPRMFIPLVPIMAVFGVILLKRLRINIAITVAVLVIAGSLALDITTIAYKIHDNRRKTTKFIEGLPNLSYFLLGTKKYDPRIPPNLKQSNTEPDIIILVTESMVGLKRQLDSTKLFDNISHEDWQILTGQRKLNLQFEEKKYRYGYPTNMAEYLVMRDLFTSGKYALNRQYLLNSNYFTRNCRLLQWEPEVYIYNRKGIINGANI